MINTLVDQHRRWIAHNFPQQNDNPHQPLLGLAEEVGELAHAHLKAEQGIRGFADHDTAQKAKEDAVGDIFTYLMSYCIANEIDLERAVTETLYQVWKRNWREKPVDAAEWAERNLGMEDARD